MQFLRRSLMGILLMALTIGAIGWAGVSVWQAVSAMLNEEPDNRPRREVVLAVNTAEITAGREVPVMRVFGEMRSRRSLVIRASAAGRLVELSPNFQDGGRVEAGELLARVDPAETAAALALTRTDHADAEAALREAERGITLAQDDLGVAREQADLRAQALARQEDLRDRGVGSASAVETAALAAASARQSIVSRRQALAQSEAQVDQAVTRLERSAVALSEAERLLSETEIRAKFSGTLGEVSVLEGGLVSRNEQIARLTDPGALDVAFRLSTAQYARLLDDDGQLRRARVEVVLDMAGLSLVAEGRIDRESAQVGAGQTGRLVFARIDDAVGFRAGDIITVQIREPALRGVARLPARAVGAEGTVLVIGEDERLREAPVEVLRQLGDEVLVSAPDLEAVSVVAERTPLLGAGIRVRPLAPRDPEAPTEMEAPEMVTLTPEKRAELIAFVEENQRMPDEARARVLGLLEKEEVPAQIVKRLEGRMGG